MSLSQFFLEAPKWFAWLAGGLGLLTLLSFIINWGAKFRLIGATIFSLLLSASFWAFSESYSPPVAVDGYIYSPVVYDNGSDLVVAQASTDFPEQAIYPTLEQIAGNLKGGGRNGSIVHVRLRKLVTNQNRISEPIILGEVIRDINNKMTILTPIQEDEI